MRYFFFLCLALFCAADCSRAQNQSEPPPTAPSVAVPTYGIYTHARIQGAIRTACGVTPVLLRPPYGALNKPEHVWIPQRLKLNVIYWSVDTLDWKHPGAATITQRVLAGARPGAIILQHDIHGQTIDAMATALDGLMAKGYHLVTISQLIAMESPQVSPTPSPHVNSGP